MARATLQRGSKGSDVSELQTILNKSGYNLTVDGDFGAKTEEAVRDYQTKNGLGVDGIVGANTWSKLIPTVTTPQFKYDAYTPTINTPTFKYDTFTPDPFTKSDDLVAAEGQSKAAEDAVAKFGDFTWDKQGDYDAMYKKYTERGPFSYDFNADALYQQYKDMYMKQGKMAMADTMGQAAAMTGGYGNSYAATVGNQAYQASLEQLNSVIPELYQLALSKYNMEGQDMLNALGLMESDRAFDYGLHTDEYGKLVSDRGYYGDKANNMYGREYGEYMDALGIEQGEHHAEQEYEYQTGRDSVADQQWLAGIEQAEHQAAKGYEYQLGRDAVADQQWQAEFDEAKRQYDESQAVKGTGGSGGGGGGNPMYDGNGNLREGYTSDNPEFFDDNGNFKKATFSRYDSEGNAVWYIGGKEVKRQAGANPYTGAVNPDTKHGTFSNGYQPNNIKGQKLTKSGITDSVNGVQQNVWQTPDGKLWIWDGTKNEYLSYEE